MKKLIKRILPFALVVAMCLCGAVSASASESVYLCDGYPKPTQAELQASLASTITNARVEPRGLYSSLTVTVCEPCDEEFRALFSNWMYQADLRVELADNDIYDWFGIDYLSVSQIAWTSDSVDDYDLYYEAVDTVGKNGADLMIAFSAQDSTYGGLGSSGGYCVCWEFGVDYTSNTVVHESGHMYGVYVDGGCTEDCIMSGVWHEICSSCASIWSSNKYMHS